MISGGEHVGFLNEHLGHQSVVGSPCVVVYSVHFWSTRVSWCHDPQPYIPYNMERLGYDITLHLMTTEVLSPHLDRSHLLTQAHDHSHRDFGCARGGAGPIRSVMHMRTFDEDVEVENPLTLRSCPSRDLSSFSQSH